MDAFRSGVRVPSGSQAFVTAHSAEVLSRYFRGVDELIGYVDPDTGWIATSVGYMDPSSGTVKIEWKRGPDMTITGNSYTSGYGGGGSGYTPSITSNTSNTYYYGGSGGSHSPNYTFTIPTLAYPPPPIKKNSLQWLDSQIEAMCKKGRLA